MIFHQIIVAEFNRSPLVGTGEQNLAHFLTDFITCTDVVSVYYFTSSKHANGWLASQLARGRSSLVKWTPDLPGKKSLVFTLLQQVFPLFSSGQVLSHWDVEKAGTDLINDTPTGNR